MKRIDTKDRSGSPSVGIHWLMVLLIAAVYACIELRGIFPKGSDSQEGLKAWHFALGVSVLVLAALRVLRRVTHAAPRIEPELPRWQLHLATLMHLALYGLMISMPLLGWLTLIAQGKPIPFFGLHLPPLTAEQKLFSDWVKEIRELMGTVGYFLVVLHASAALYRHYVVRDNTLRRMLPRRG